MPESVGNIKAAILIHIQGSDEPIEIGTVEIPIRAQKVADGVVQCSLDTSVFGDFGKALATALDTEQSRPESVEVLMARQRLVDAEDALAYAQKQAEADGPSQLAIRDAMLDVKRAQADLKYAQEKA